MPANHLYICITLLAGNGLKSDYNYLITNRRTSSPSQSHQNRNGSTCQVPNLSSRQVLIPQELAQFGPRLPHHWVLLGTPLPHPRLVPPRTPRVDHHLRHLLPLLGTA